MKNLQACICLIYFTGGALCLVGNVSISIETSRFLNNSAGVEAGVLQIEKNVSVKFSSCVISRNSAQGGAILVGERNSSVQLQNCTIYHNQGTATGAMIYMLNGMHLVARNTTFIHNYCDGQPLIYGEGESSIIFTQSNISQNSGDGVMATNTGTNVTLTHCWCEKNNDGSIVSIKNGHLSIVSSSFDGNVASLKGSVFVCMSCNATVRNSIFTNNRADQDAGVGSIDTNSYVKVMNSTFLYNSAGSDAGALQSMGSTLELYDCNISYNVGGNRAGAIFVGIINSKFKAVNVFLSENTAHVEAGGVCVQNNVDVTLDQCIFLNNKAPSAKSVAIGTDRFRIANSSLSSLTPGSHLTYPDGGPSHANLYTYITTIKSGNISLNTNGSNFIDVAQQLGIITISGETTVSKEETQFASGKHERLGISAAKL